MVIKVMKAESFVAWAISSGQEDGGLLEEYFLYKVPTSLEGCKFSLFRTRADARAFLKKIGLTPLSWHLRVVKVHILIEDAKWVEENNEQKR